MTDHWKRKFANAFRGIGLGMAGQSSFLVHLLFTVGVVVLAALLQCELWQCCVLGLCIAMVLSLELINSSIEMLARGLCPEHNEDVGKSLDIASGAVLLASLVAACVGLAVFTYQAWVLLVVG